MKSQQEPSQIILRDTKGQTLVEFILLFAMISLIALTMMKIMNYRVSERWKQLVEIIVAPTDSAVEIAGQN